MIFKITRVFNCLFVFLLLVSLPFGVGFAYQLDGESGASGVTQPYDEAKLAFVSSQFGGSSAPERDVYAKTIRSRLESDRPILPLASLENPEAILAQSLFLNDEQIKKSSYEPQSQRAVRSEVMSVLPALPGDRAGSGSACWEGGCYRVNLYNFYFNATLSGLVDTKNKQVLSIVTINESQPDLSKRLEVLAEAIAKHEPAVQLEVSRYLKFIGDTSKASDVMPVMVSTKSALKNTLCERSKHLCVAPTYVLGDKALWVIVDLTDMKVAGLRWTTVGDSGPPTVITERILENEYVYKNYCEQINSLNRAGWEFDYHITTSDGLRLANARYKGKNVFESAKVVDWHVSYSRKDKFGYSDATGCPMFSSAVVVAFDGPKIQPIVERGQEVGFSIAQEFQQQSWPAACNYRYEERYEFFNDGRYRVKMISHGRGCGDYGTYRPVFRIDLGASLLSNNTDVDLVGKPAAPTGSKSDVHYSVERWADSWKPVMSESWTRQREPSRLAERKYSHRILAENGDGFYLEPSAGNFGDGGRGDDAYIYLTVHHSDKDEGNQDLVTLGSCCNTGHEQGPELFMQPAEPLEKQRLVLWYVPQMKNDGRKGNEYCWAENQVANGKLEVKTWPCTAGPMFVPIEVK